MNPHSMCFPKGAFIVYDVSECLFTVKLEILASFFWHTVKLLKLKD